MQMVSLGVYSWNSGRVLGPILGSLLVLAVGPAWTIAFNAFSFVVMAGAVVAVRRSFRPHGDAGSVRERLTAGALLPGHWYARAQRFRRWFYEAALKVFITYPSRVQS